MAKPLPKIAGAACKSCFNFLLLVFICSTFSLMLGDLLLLAVLSFWGCLGSGVWDGKGDGAQDSAKTVALKPLTQGGGEMAVKEHIEISPTVIPADLKTPAHVAESPTAELAFPIALPDYNRFDVNCELLQMMKG